MIDPEQLLDALNDAQREAVAAEPGRTLVLAGAGSGKTRVLTRRAAWLVAVEGAAPQELLAVTFTNKAAGEMRQRIGELLGLRTAGIWVGTFHGIAHRLLRIHTTEAKLPEGFQIADADDQLRVVKRVLAARGSPEKQFPPRQVRNWIASQKEKGRRLHDLPAPESTHDDELHAVYQDYEAACHRGGIVDFAELLLRSFELLRDNPALHQLYQDRFASLLVDEFQDTNDLQYRWLSQLIAPHSEVFIVGDDDQSIYGWRGAQVGNLERFRTEHAPVRLLRLERNYRSSGTILDAANHLIRHNAGRIGKELWTERGRGEPITVFTGFNEIDEARWIAGTIRRQLDQGEAARGDFAVLYRSNAQSRAIEEALIAEQLTYRIYGGVRFFERAEVKDALAYLRLVLNRHDDAAFERVVNVPSRGVGARTVDAVRSAAREADVSLFTAARELIQANALAARARKAVTEFLDRIADLEEATRGCTLDEQVDRMIRETGLRAWHERDGGDRADSRLENLDELINAARSFEHAATDDPELPETDALTAFLSHAALESGDNPADEGEAAVQLMTLHSAKGLEFPTVFLAGLEEGLFPHRMSVEEPGRLEEERRLCYVGVTRACERLYVSYAEKRRVHGVEQPGRPSRFLEELPADALATVRPGLRVGAGARPTARGAGLDGASGKPNGLSDDSPDLGSRVRHPKFGDGVVLAQEGQGPNARLQVRFDEAGTKWLVSAYAKLAPVG